MGFKLIDSLTSPSTSAFTIILFILLILALGIGVSILSDKWNEWFINRHEAKVLLIEREQPILFEKSIEQSSEKIPTFTQRNSDEADLRERS
ncbi:hypothetical protein [Streptococcus pluranimalium]|uniref:hypothetical protein n=1 Tax=Streptococcus pluranimalium TaxID=82348 RepID=UPI004046CA45